MVMHRVLVRWLPLGLCRSQTMCCSWALLMMASIDSSGRAVLFAGITVIISLLGLMAMGLAFVNGLAISGSVAVLVMMLAALTLL